jgi:hypothetical protein
LSIASLAATQAGLSDWSGIKWASALAGQPECHLRHPQRAFDLKAWTPVVSP